MHLQTIIIIIIISLLDKQQVCASAWMAEWCAYRPRNPIVKGSIPPKIPLSAIMFAVTDSSSETETDVKIKFNFNLIFSIRHFQTKVFQIPLSTFQTCLLLPLPALPSTYNFDNSIPSSLPSLTSNDHVELIMLSWLS